MVQVQLTRLASIKTVVRRTPSASETVASQVPRRSSFAAPQNRISSTNRAGGEWSASSSSSNSSSVCIEVFVHGALGNEAVLVASLSNSTLLVIRIESDGIRSWVLDWPLAGKIRGLCVSPDLQCVLCVTEGLEGVYLLAVDNLGDQDEAQPHPASAVPNLEDAPTSSNLPGDASSLQSGGGGGGKRSAPATTSAVGAATTARHAAPRRTIAETAFPSLAHLASRGEQRKRASGAKAGQHPSAEPVFIASLARRAAGGGAGGDDGKGQEQQSDDDRGSRRHSTGSSGRALPRRRGGARSAAAPFECLWWVTREGSHFAVIGGPGGELHFLDLERLDAWVVTPPPPTMARGRVCALTVVTGLAGATAPIPSSRAAPTGSDSAPFPLDKPNDKSAGVADGGGAAAAAGGGKEELHSPPRHLVAVLETGAVFVVLLERENTGENVGGSSSNSSSSSSSRSSSSASGEGDKPESENQDKSGKRGGSGDHDSSKEKIVRLQADWKDRPGFAPSWLDVGRGGGGGGGGGMGVRAIPPSGFFGRGSTPTVGGGADLSSDRLRMSIVSRAWGNKCAVKILRVASAPGGSGGAKGNEQHHQQGWGLEWGAGSSSSGKKQALRTETVRQVTLPVDHHAPEQHALAVVDGSWAVLASPPAGGAPARVAVAALGGPERPTTQPVSVFPLPPGEHVGGVALLPCGGRADGSSADHGGASSSVKSGPDSDSAETSASGGSWGLVWSQSCVYRIDLGGDAGRVSVPPRKEPSPSAPRPQAPTRRRQPVAGTAGSIALRRPSAASVRRARELHAAGRLVEATKVAMEALDGNEALSATPPPGAGGGATTRMVREELANSLLEWLVRLHVQQTSADPLSAVADVHSRGGGGGARADAAAGGAGGDTRSRGSGSSSCGGGGGGGTPENDASKARRPTTGSREGVPQGRREPKPTRSSTQRVSKTRSVKHDPAATAEAPKSAVDTPSPPPPSGSLLERYLLSSRDYDPVLAATLLHSHGEADLAVVAGTAREGGGRGGAVAALPNVLRVLAESTWVPRLGTRGVEALCGDDTGAAAREAILAGGGTLFAALEPRLRLRLLLSDRSILFGGAGAAGLGIEGEAQATEAVKGEDEESVAGAIASVRTHLSPFVSELSVKDLHGLVSRLAEWCKEDTTPPAEGCRPEDTEDIPAVASAAAAESAHGGGDDDCPSEAALEALEVLLQALCELSGRRPPSGERHRSAWSQAGCIVDTPGSPEEVESRPPSPPRLEWGQLTPLLRDICADDGATPPAAGDGDDDAGAGGLPTTARRRLLRVLPIVRGWHDSVVCLVRSREAGCWAAVALQLELSGNRREAASATLHGVVCLLQEGAVGSPGDSPARILSGKGCPREHTASGDQWSPGATDAPVATAEERRRTASEAILRVIHKYAFPQCCGPGDSGDDSKTKGSLVPTTTPPPALPTSSIILAHACVLAEALCVWKHFGLPPAELETALQPRLNDRDGVRVLAAVFFSQLSRDATTLGNGAPARDWSAPQEELVWRRGPGAAGAWGRQAPASLNGSLRAVATDSASRPSPAQIEAASGLGLSPRFSLALMRIAGSSSAQGDTGGGGGGGSITLGPPMTLSSSPLTFLLQHRATGAEATSSSCLGLTHARSSSSSSSPSIGGARGEIAGVGSGAWESGPTRAAAAGTTAEGAAVWRFSCGHRFARERLLGSVVPASVSSIKQATASLQRTQQVLALEYEGRRSGAACPECAAKELVRLAEVAGASMQTRNAVPVAPPLPTTPQRLQMEGTPRVR